MPELLIQAAVTAALTLLIKGWVYLYGMWISWWLAALIAAVFVFGGWAVLRDNGRPSAFSTIRAWWQKRTIP